MEHFVEAFAVGVVIDSVADGVCVEGICFVDCWTSKGWNSMMQHQFDCLNAAW